MQTTINEDPSSTYIMEVNKYAWMNPVNPQVILNICIRAEIV